VPLPSLVLAASALALTIIPTPARAQWSPTRHFPVGSGLSQSQVTALLQCPRGYVWIATLSGLSRFDGKRFVNFSTLDGLPDDVLSALAVGDNGALLIGTDSGRASRLVDGGFTVIGSDGPGAPVVGLVQCGADVVVASEAGLVRVSPSGAQVSLLSEPVHALATAGDGRSLVVGPLLYRLSASGLLEPLDASAPRGATVRAAAADGEAWLLGLAGGTVVRGSGSGTWTEVARVDRVEITALLRGSDDTLWIGSTDGLWSLDGGGDVRRNRLGPLSDVDEVRALLEDREGNVWVGTWGDGLYQIAGAAFAVIDRESGLPSPTVWGFLDDPPDCVWLATEDAGAVRWCRGRVAEQLRPGHELPPGRVMELEHGADGSLWLATSAGLLRRSRSGAMRRFTVADGLPDDYVRSLQAAGGGKTWAATRSGLALVGDRVEERWTERDGLPDANLRGLARDRSGRLWIATHAAGLVSFDGSRFTRLSTDEGLPHARVWCVTVDSRDVVWAGTDAGVWTRSATGGAARVIGVTEGLPNQNVLSLVEDGNGDLWAGTTRGLATLSPVGGVIRTLTADQGLAGSEGNEGAAMLASDGRLWFGLSEGISIIDPRRLRANPLPPLMVIESLTVDGTPWSDPFPVASGIPAPEPFLHLPPDVREIRFDFAALSFTAPQKVRYRFSLGGYDARGPTVTEDRHVTFRSLPPKRYRFELEAANDAGVWSPEPLAVTFTVPARWYQDRRIQSALALVAVVAGGATLRLRFRRERRRQRDLAEQVRQRTAELATAYRRIAEQNTQLQDLSRTDPLTGLKNRRLLAEQLPVEMAVLRREASRVAASELPDFHGTCLYLIDLDDFKRVNDLFGHEVGDRVLVAVAKAIEATLREGDLAVRWGGDEMVVLARGIDDAGAATFASRLLAGVAAAEPAGPASRVAVTASIGFLTYPLSSTDFIPTFDWPRLLEIADRLMYRAKAGGRGRACGLCRRPPASGAVAETALLDGLAASIDPSPSGVGLVVVPPPAPATGPGERSG